jgi:ubiquinone/menaquinone biosynthesis C-methylase UbiE
MDEKEKYERYWEIPSERKVSPGMRTIEEFSAEARERGFAKILDLGCGQGKTTVHLLDDGFDVIATDIAHNCLNDDLQSTLYGCFVPAPAWDLPFDDDCFDCVFSCDVLEHIPLELVHDTLVELARVAPVAYLEIASFDRHVTHTSGEHLHVHLAVQSIDWWRAELEKAGWVIEKAYDRKASAVKKTPGYAIWSTRNAKHN